MKIRNMIRMICPCALAGFLFVAAGCARGRMASEESQDYSYSGQPPEETQKNQIRWLRYYEAMRPNARADRKQILFFTRDSCEPCDMMEKWTFTDAGVLRALKDFVPVRIDGDVELQLVRRFRVKTFPMLMVVGLDDEEIDRKAGYRDARFVLEWTRNVKANRGTMKALDEQLNRKPADPDLLLQQARNLLDANDIEKAIELGQKATDASPGNANTLAFFGLCYLRQDKLDAAEAAATAALQIDPQNRAARHVAITVLSRRAEEKLGKGDTDAAIKLFSDIMEKEPENFEARIGIGRAHMKAGETDKAAARFEEAAALEPHSPIPHALLGDLHLQTGDDSRAEQEYLKAIEIEPTYEMPHFRLMELYEKTGRCDDLMRMFEKIALIDPAGANNEIAWLMATSKHPDILNPQEAIKHANTAVEFEPQPWYIDTLAEAYYAAREFDLAIAVIKEAIAKKPEDMQYYQGQLEKFQKAQEQASLEQKK